MHWGVMQVILRQGTTTYCELFCAKILTNSICRGFVLMNVFEILADFIILLPLIIGDPTCTITPSVHFFYSSSWTKVQDIMMTKSILLSHGVNKII